MRFCPTEIDGVFVIEPELLEDPRGFFARAFCREEMKAHGLNPDISQCNVSFNPHAGTLRGLHYQAAPHAEAKLVRATRGAIFDVAVDLREGSPTRCRWVGVQLSAENHKMLYVPEGFAHGYLTLAPDSEVFYQVSAAYHPDSGRGVRWDDPAFGIEWPAVEQHHMNDRDRTYPDFTP